MPTITRRAVLCGSTVAAAVSAASTIPTLAIANTGDEALIQAEREAIELWTWADAHAHTDELVDEVGERGCEIELCIAETPCQTLVGAAVKLRRLLDPHTGIQAGGSERDLVTLRRVLVVVERLAGGAA